MKKASRQFWALLLCLTVAVQIMPLQVFAASTQTVNTQIAEETTANTPVEIIGENASLRSENEKHFFLSDGNCVAVHYGQPVHYADDAGVWQDIDNSLAFVETANGKGVYRTGNKVVPISFATDLTDGKILSTSTGNTSVSMYLLDSAQANETVLDNQISLGGNESEQLSWHKNIRYNRTASAQVAAGHISGRTLDEAAHFKTEAFIPEKLESSVLYENVFSGVDLQYTACSYSVKEQIIVKSAQNAYRYDFLLQLDGLTAQLNQDGSVSLRDNRMVELYHIPAPYMEDAAGAHTTEVNYILNESTAGTILTVEASSDWMNAEERVFPVVIDPTLEMVVRLHSINQTADIYATYVIENTPNTTQNGYQHLYVGYGAATGECRSYLHFNNLPTIPNGSVVVGAALNMYQEDYTSVGCPTLPLAAYEVSCSDLGSDGDWYQWIQGMTWNNQPDMDTTNEIDYVNASASTTGSYLYWDITELAKKWYAEGDETRTIAIAPPHNESYSSTKCALPVFYAYGSSIGPALIVTYRSSIGIEPYYTYTNLTAGNAGTAYIADATGQLKVVKNIFSYASSVNPFSLNLVYNSDYFSTSGTADDCIQENLGIDMLFGCGFKLDIIQTMQESSIPGYLVYADGDGTAHYFRATDQANQYQDEDGLGLTVTVEENGNYKMTDKAGNTWIFADTVLTEMSDEAGNKITVDYRESDAGHWINSICQENVGGNEITLATLSYLSGTSYVEKITDAAGRVYQFAYSNDKLTTISLNGTMIARYSYEANSNRLVGMEDLESGYWMWFTYENGKVNSYQEWIGYENSGACVQITYPDSSQTVYRDFGADRTANTADDILTCYLFDDAGRSVNAYTIDDNWKLYGASNAVYTDTTGKTNNRTRRTASIGATGMQLLRNSGFESTSTNTWSLSGATESSTLSVTNACPRTGTYALQGYLPSDSADNLRATHTTASLAKNNVYTFSGYINTRSLTAIGSGGVYLKVSDSEGNTWSSEKINFNSAAGTENGWVRISVPFYTRVDGVHTVAIYADGVAGTFYADDLQLELGNAPSNRNLLENGNLYDGSHGWTFGSGATRGSLGNITISGSPADDIAASNSVASAWQYVNVNLPATQTYVLSGWAKGNAVPDRAISGSDSMTISQRESAEAQDRNRSFGLRAIVYYTDNTGEYHYVPFNPDLTDWQYTSLTIVPRQPGKTVQQICVVCAYERNANTSVFDDISLVCEAAQTMKYDDEGNLISISSTGQEDEYATYEGDLIKTYTGGSGTYTYTYDESYQHRVTSVTDGVITQNMSYDGFGNVTNTTLTGSDGAKLTASVSYTIDGNRVASVTDGAGNTVSYAYSGTLNELLGAATTVTDGRNITTTYAYDTQGRLTDASVASFAALHYTYDNGSLSEIARTNNSSAQTYSFTHDIWGNTTQIRVGSQTLASYDYAANNGELTKLTYGNGAAISYTYDVLGRIKTATWSGGRILTYTYTGDGQVYSIHDSKPDRTYYFEYDTLGRLIGSRTGTTRSRYGYDTNNRLTKWDFTTPATGMSGESYTYDTDTSNSISDGTLLYMGLVSGNYLNYTYDSLQRLTDKYIQLYSDGYGQQVWERYFYADDAENGTASTQVSGKNTWIGNTPVHEFEYTYDAAGNITKEREKLSDRTVDYTYDSLGQLTKAQYSNGRTEEYTYDGAGNILSFHNGTTSHTYTYGNNDWRDLLTAVDGQAITYDNVGNPLSYYNGDRYTFSWTEGRKLASSTYDGRTTTYEYDHEGLRTKKEKSDGSYILYDIVDGRAVGETYYSASHAVQYYLRYIFDENAGVIGISLWYPGNTAWTDYYFVKNLQGDVLQVYKASDHSLVASYTYDSWGNILSKSGSLADINPFRYRGYYYDNETGLYYVSSRYYDPEIGRFINADDIAYLGMGGLTSYNLFAYCGNNPVMGYDPYGTFDWSSFGKGAGWLAIGITAICVGVSVLTCGVAAPAMMAVAAVTVTAGALTAVNGVSELGEAATGHNFVRDDVFRGNEKAYDVYSNTTAAVAEIGTAICGGWTAKNAPRIKAYNNIQNYNYTDTISDVTHMSRPYANSVLTQKQVIKYGKMTKDSFGYVFSAMGSVNGKEKLWRLGINTAKGLVWHWGHGF